MVRGTHTLFSWLQDDFFWQQGRSPLETASVRPLTTFSRDDGSETHAVVPPRGGLLYCLRRFWRERASFGARNFTVGRPQIRRINLDSHTASDLDRSRHTVEHVSCHRMQRCVGLLMILRAIVMRSLTSSPHKVGTKHVGSFAGSGSPTSSAKRRDMLRRVA